MVNVTFFWYSASYSLKKLLRNKYALIAEILQLSLVIFLMLVYYYLNLLPPNDFVYVIVSLLTFLSINSATKVGVQFIFQKNQGFFQELHSAPTSTTEKIVGLILNESAIVFLQIGIFMLLVPLVANVSISLPQFLAACAIVIVTLFSASFISIIISSKTENQQLLTILMLLFSISQVALNGLLIKFESFPFIALNPYSYVSDIFLYASGQTPNYPIFADIIVGLALLLLTHYIAYVVIENMDV